MAKVILSGECIRNDDGSCTITVQPVEGSSCDCANLSIRVNCKDDCCSDSGCC